jgi:hypothetical protein
MGTDNRERERPLILVIFDILLQRNEVLQENGTEKVYQKYACLNFMVVGFLHAIAKSVAFFAFIGA